MKIGFYAGSFDPFTFGHLKVIEKASVLFDKVIVGIAVNTEKQRRFDKIAMQNAMNKVFENYNLKNVECICYNTLSAEIAKQYNTTFFIRGIRNGSDYDYEENLALINQEVSGIDTIYIRAGDLGAVSSSMVYELYKNGKDISKYAPKEIIDVIKGE
ncbi:MAG: pantetheine-phosphate adenylyltransferase [Clostridia bacterium]|nr:pantetheine-phosphate adenylyltransferase [Clostridia bacterium]